MDPRRPRDPDDRSSIFSRPDDQDEDLRPAAPPRRPEPPDWHDASTRSHAVVGTETPAAPPAPVDARVIGTDVDGAIHRETARGLSRRQKLGLAALSLGGLVVVGSVVATLSRSPATDAALAGSSANPTLTPSMTVEPTNSPEPSESEQPSPTAPTTAPATSTWVPTPAGPPQELARGGWATVAVGELNVRRDPGLGATSVYRLVSGAVVHVHEDPVVSADNLTWYRITSLGGADGWAASGPASSPFLTVITADHYLRHCARVEQPVFDENRGRLTKRDPILVGRLAFPASQFSDGEAAVLELMRGVRTDVCLDIELDRGTTASVSVDTGAHACGEFNVRDGARRLLPSSATNAQPAIQVKEATFVHPTVLTSPDDTTNSSHNMRIVFDLTAANPRAAACIQLQVVERPRHQVDHHRLVQAVQCMVVEEWDGEMLNIRLASSRTAQWLVPTSRHDDVPIGIPIGTTVVAGESSSSGSFAGVTEVPLAGCG